MVDQIKEEAQVALQKIWPGWNIVDFIGEGAFGKVYKIERKEFGYTYDSALKIIRIPQNEAELMMVINHGLDEKSTETYFRDVVEEVVKEFALMAQLKGNSNIVSYEDHVVVPIEGQIGWHIYIRMELLTPLYTAVQQSGFDKVEMIQVGIDIAKAIELCHSRNIIHRDIKPANIFKSQVGDYKLGDFGIAKKIEKAKTEMSKKGTSSYMAPEVYRFENYDTTVDIYSLGILLYRFLNNNRLPFLPLDKPVKFNDMEAANQRRFSGETMPKPVNAQGRLGDIILKACAFHAKDRYQKAEDLRKDLEQELECEIAARQIENLFDHIIPTLGNDLDVDLDQYEIPSDSDNIILEKVEENELDATRGVPIDSLFDETSLDKTQSLFDDDMEGMGNPPKKNNIGMVVLAVSAIALIICLAYLLV